MANAVQGFSFALHGLWIGLIDWSLVLPTRSIMGAIWVIVEQSGCLTVLSKGEISIRTFLPRTAYLFLRISPSQTQAGKADPHGMQDLSVIHKNETRVRCRILSKLWLAYDKVPDEGWGDEMRKVK